jgi:hypothetical protein
MKNKTVTCSYHEWENTVMILLIMQWYIFITALETVEIITLEITVFFSYSSCLSIC